jgi:hypothetical protein
MNVGGQCFVAKRMHAQTRYKETLLPVVTTTARRNHENH